MDLRFLLNPLPEDEVPRITMPPNSGPSQARAAAPGSPPEAGQAQSTASYIQSRFLLSPRRLDADTASVSSTSSTKRRRNNRGGKIEVRAPAMGRSFSEIEVPSEDSSNEEQEAVKRGVAQLSLSGMPRGVGF